MKKFYLILIILFSLPVVLVRANTIDVISPPSSDIIGATNTGGNIININTDNISFKGFSVIGAYNKPSSWINISNNTINITARRLTDIRNIYGGQTYGSYVRNSVINISGEISSVAGAGKGGIYGGWGDNSDYPTFDTPIYNNTINISGNAVIKDFNIYGGWYKGSGGGAFSNTINISGTPDLSTSSIFGSNPGGSDNTLNLSTHISVLTAGYFQKYNFYTDGININNPMLKATQTTVDMSDSVIGLYLQAGSQPLNGGDKIFLVENMTGIGLTQASKNLRAGATMIYDWELSVEGSNLFAVIKNDIIPPPPETCETNPDLCDNGNGGGNGAGKLNPETKSLLEGNLSSLGVLIQGADLIADSNDTLDSMLYEDSNGMFSGINVSSIKLTSGSHVDVQSGSLIIGAGSKMGIYTYGAFVEAGSGKHNTHNEFEVESEKTIVRGDGKNAYVGAGILGRLSFDFIYVDGSIRGGYATTNYTADYSPDAKYNIGSAYYGGHAGFGLLQSMGKFTLNEYVKYLATAQQGQTITLDSKEEINFANIMSSRAVAGLRAKYNGVYLGYAYEQELAGESSGTASNATGSNMAIESPTIKGGTSVIEAGYNQSLSLRASRFYESSGFNVGMGGKYYIGTRNGFSANMKIGYLF
ncbi:MAG: hypothetical protein LBQ34_07775 [Alphaproteobacteria bacterium]|nr:hypothetical protein [Alphaproteobacteria bacterium]